MQNPNLDPNDESFWTIMTYHFYISDDKQHDSYFVQHCLMLHWDDLVATGFVPKQHSFGLMVVALSLRIKSRGIL